MAILLGAYPDLIHSDRVVVAAGSLIPLGGAPIPVGNAVFTQSDSDDLSVVMTGVDVTQAWNLFNATLPGQSYPDVKFVGSTLDGRWSVEADSFNPTGQSISSGSASRLTGITATLTATRLGSSSHGRTIVGIGDFVAPGFAGAVRVTVGPDGQKTRHHERVIIPLPKDVPLPNTQGHLHLLSTRLADHVSERKRDKSPVLSAFIDCPGSNPVNPESVEFDRLRSILRFASATSVNLICVLDIDAAGEPYRFKAWNAPSSMAHSSMSAMPLRQDIANNHTGKFVERVWSDWPKAEKLGVDLAMHFALQSMEAPSLEIRFATLSVAFEAISAHHATATGFTKSFGSSLPRKSLKALLREVSIAVGVAWSLADFIDVRNAILHEGKLLPKATFKAYCEFLDALYRIVLKGIGYSGPMAEHVTFGVTTV